MIRTNSIDIQDGYYGIVSINNDKECFYPVGRAFYIDLIECNFEDESIYVSFHSEYRNRVITNQLLLG